MLELLRLAIALVGSAIGGRKDLKTTDVPDKLVFGMIGAGLLLNFIEWIAFGSWSLFQSSVLVTAGFGAFGIVMYKAGAWGGADGAMLTAIGALLPIWPIPIVPSLLTVLPFPFVYFVSTFMVGLVWSVGYVVNRVMRSPGLRRRFVSGVRKRKAAAAISVIASVIALASGPPPFSFVLALLLLALSPMQVLVSVSEPAFQRKLSTRLLRVGDMLGEDLPKLKLRKRELRGLTAAEVARIRKVQRMVMIHEGVPYVPVFFFALLAMLALEIFLV